MVRLDRRNTAIFSRLLCGREKKKRGGERERDACFSLIVEADLAGVHASILLEIGPRGVDDGNVVFFIS